MQSSPEDRVRDWFLHKDCTVLRIYGFTGEPYKLTAFLTPRVFALVFMRQRLHSEEEHFGAFKKSSNIKFPLKVGPFIFKNKGSLVFIERLLGNMEFQKEPKENYDPHHIISLRKQANKNKPFEHQFIEGLNEMANLLQFMEIQGSGGNASALLVTISQVSEGPNVLIKRSLSEIESMEVDEDGSHKKAKLLQVGGVSSEENSDDFKRVALVPTKSVQLNQFYFKEVDS